MDKAILHKLDQIEKLPTLPTVYHRISSVVNDPNSSIDDVVELIRDDPAIVANLLRLANSAFYSPGYGQRIVSPDVAVSRLGMAATRNLVLTTSVLTAFESPGQSLFDRSLFWKHCICCGIVAQTVYEFCRNQIRGKMEQSELHLVGILHDVGKIVMEANFYDDFQSILGMAAERRLPLHAAERQYWNCDHTEIGEWLCRNWSLDGRLASVVRWHHEPLSAPEDHRVVAALVHIADYICNKEQFGDSGDRFKPEFDGDVWRFLGLELKHLGDLLDQVNQEVLHSEVFLSLNAA